jgi:NAD(P)H dehydrogenase (quinone)
MGRGTVLVYGATGTQGGPVVEHLLDSGRHVRAVTRDASRAEHWAARGAEVAVADLGDPGSLAAANEGVEQVVLQLPLQYDFALHETYGRNAIDAARAAGVRLLVFNTSAQVLQGTDVEIYRVRQEVVDHLQRHGPPSIVLRPTFYMEVLLGPWIRPGIVGQGVLAFPLPADIPMSWVSARETAAYAAAALDRDDLVGRTFDIGGPEPLTGEDMAREFSDALGRDIAYVPISADDYQRALAPVFGPAVASAVAAQVRCVTARGGGALDMTGTAELFSVPPVPLRSWIRAHDWQPQEPAGET